MRLLFTSLILYYAVYSAYSNDFTQLCKKAIGSWFYFRCSNFDKSCQDHCGCNLIDINCTPVGNGFNAELKCYCCPDPITTPKVTTRSTKITSSYVFTTTKKPTSTSKTKVISTTSGTGFFYVQVCFANSRLASY